MEDLEFEGLSEVSLKVAITVFHISSKFFSAYYPRLGDLLAWGGNKITKREIIECEATICWGLDYYLSTH